MINNKLKTFLQTTFGLSDAEFDETLTKNDISSWDSLRHMVLITGLENEFGIELTVMDIVSMQSLPVIVQTLRDKGVDVEE